MRLRELAPFIDGRDPEFCRRRNDQRTLAVEIRIGTYEERTDLPLCEFLEGFGDLLLIAGAFDMDFQTKRT